MHSGFSHFRNGQINSIIGKIGDLKKICDKEEKQFQNRGFDASLGERLAALLANRVSSGQPEES